MNQGARDSVDDDKTLSMQAERMKSIVLTEPGNYNELTIQNLPLEKSGPTKPDEISQSNNLYKQIFDQNMPLGSLNLAQHPGGA